jgi:hypothetical protein
MSRAVSRAARIASLGVDEGETPVAAPTGHGYSRKRASSPAIVHFRCNATPRRHLCPDHSGFGDRQHERPAVTWLPTQALKVPPRQSDSSGRQEGAAVPMRGEAESLDRSLPLERPRLPRRDPDDWANPTVRLGMDR